MQEIPGRRIYAEAHLHQKQCFALFPYLVACGYSSSSFAASSRNWFLRIFPVTVVGKSCRICT